MVWAIPRGLGFREQRGRLDMETLCCCDMSGCIAFFEAIDPEVEEIEERRRGKKERPPEGGPSSPQISLGLSEAGC
jgi:hypothetical protein